MKNIKTEAFRKCFNKLPHAVQKRANEVYSLFKENPYHPSLHFKCVNAKESVYSARVGSHYRVLGIRDGDTIYWFWIGTHEEYNKLI